MTTIKVNGVNVEVNDGDELQVVATNVATEPTMDEAIETLEVKETLGSRIKALPWWKKAAALGGALAGGLFIASKFAPTEDDETDEEDEDETDEEEE